MLLAGRVRKPEEALTIQDILEKHFKRTVNPDALFSEDQVTSQFSEFSSFTRVSGNCLTTWSTFFVVLKRFLLNVHVQKNV